MALMNRIGNSVPKTKSRKNWLLISLGLAATSALSYFGFQYWKKHRSNANQNTDVPEFNPKAKPQTKAPKVKPVAKKVILPKQALPKFNAPETAKQIHAAIVKKDFKKVLSLLKTIKTVANYSAVNKTISGMLVNGVKQTLVNAALSSFKDEKQNSAIRSAFAAMGLKYNGKKWSLSGIEDKNLLITTSSTKVWRDPKTSVAVPANMVLGNEIAKRGNYTVFLNDNKYFLVESKDIKNYKN
jgi:hypothetical protein